MLTNGFSCLTENSNNNIHKQDNYKCSSHNLTNAFIKKKKQLMNKCHNVRKIECKASKAMMFKIITANLIILNGEENEDKLY